MSRRDAATMHEHLPVRLAAPLVEQFAATPPASALLEPGIDARHYFARLLKNQLFQDAAQMLARGLTPRPGIWWGCLCLRDAGGQPLPGGEEAALHAAVNWVLEPNETHRLAAEAPARRATLRTPGGLLAWATLATGGNFVPAQSGRALASAVVIAALQHPDDAVNKLRRCVALGLRVANHRGHWHSEESHGSV